MAERVRRFDPIFVPLADALRDFTPFFPLEGLIRLVADWARDGLLLIGDAQSVLLGRASANPVVRWLVERVLPPMLRSPLLPRVQRRLFFGAPLPPLDRAFTFQERSQPRCPGHPAARR